MSKYLVLLSLILFIIISLALPITSHVAGGFYGVIITAALFPITRIWGPILKANMVFWAIGIALGALFLPLIYAYT